MNHKEIRWQQRFTNLKKAYDQLEKAVSNYTILSDLEKEGLIQRFEYTFELSWKTLKDYLESKGVTVSFPRDVIKEAFASQVITEGEIWMEMLDSRNMMAHTYEEEVFNDVLNKVVSRYFQCISNLVLYLDKQQ